MYIANDERKKERKGKARKLSLIFMLYNKNLQNYDTKHVT